MIIKILSLYFFNINSISSFCVRVIYLCALIYTNKKIVIILVCNLV